MYSHVLPNLIGKSNLQSLLGAQLSYKTLFVSQGPNLESKEIKRHGSFLTIGWRFCLVLKF